MHGGERRALVGVLVRHGARRRRAVGAQQQVMRDRARQQRGPQRGQQRAEWIAGAVHAGQQGQLGRQSRISEGTIAAF